MEPVNNLQDCFRDWDRDKTRDKTRDRTNRKEELSSLSKSAQKASNLLGVNSVKLLNYPDNRMDSVNILEIIKTIEKYIELYNPHTVITHHYGDLNIDHKIIHQAVITACRPEPGSNVKRILSFEIPSSTEWQAPIASKAFIPNCYENVADTITKKTKALEAYKDEMRDWPHARSLKAVEHLARWRGASVGLEAAEAFFVLREIN